MATPCRRQPPETLDAILPHVEGECHSLARTWERIRRWRRNPRSVEGETRRIALFEAWLVHVRNLVVFFRDQQDEGDEVLACHFMATPAEWAAANQAELALTVPERERLGRIQKLLAHITYDRLTAVSDFDERELEMVVRRLRVFYRDVPEPYKSRFRHLRALVEGGLAPPLAPRG